MQHNSGSQRVEADLVCAGEKKKSYFITFLFNLASAKSKHVCVG